MGKTYQSTVINAPVDKIWRALRNFHDMSWAPNVISAVDVLGEKTGDEEGAQRLLNKAFSETLLKLDDEEHTLLYSIDSGPPPLSGTDVSGYTGKIRVRPVTEDGPASFVEWSSTWKGSEEAVQNFCHPIYVALLGELKSTFE